MRFQVPVVAQRCGPGHGILLHGEERGQGVMIWLRGTDAPDTGTYPLLSRGDTTATRGVIAAVRFLVGQTAGGMTIDDGSATLRRAQAPYELQLQGLGVESAFAQQRRAEVFLEGVPMAPDSVPCQAGE
jgi:hypothetical protein